MQRDAFTGAHAGRRASVGDGTAVAPSLGSIGDGDVTRGWWSASARNQLEGKPLHGRWYAQSAPRCMAFGDANHIANHHSALTAAGREVPRPKRRRLSGGDAAGSAVQRIVYVADDARLAAVRPGRDASASGGMDASTLVGHAVVGTIESCTPAGYMVELRTGMHVMRGALACACLP